MRSTSQKALCFAVGALAGAAVGYLYLALILRPGPAGFACPTGPPHDLRCVSYQIIVSPPFFLVAGALAGLWIAYALARPFAGRGRGRGRPNFPPLEDLVAAAILLALAVWIIALRPGAEWNWNNGLGWGKVACFFLAAALARLAIGVASMAGPPGGLVLAFGLPAAFGALAYAYITNFAQPPVWHSCPPAAGAYGCAYHPLIGQIGPWIMLGALAGLWLAYAVAAGRPGSPRPGLIGRECAVAIPVLAAAVWWALVVGPDQAGQGYVDPFIAGVALAALLRLLIAGWTARREASRLVEGPAA
jgi:hypothetical protein